MNAALKELQRGGEETLPLYEEQVDGVEQPDERLERRERLRDTLAAIGALPERQRSALVKREMEGRSHTEIAHELGLTPGGARQMIHRARDGVRSAVTAITPTGLVLRASGLGAEGHTAELVAGGIGGGLAGKAGSHGPRRRRHRRRRRGRPLTRWRSRRVTRHPELQRPRCRPRRSQRRDERRRRDLRGGSRAVQGARPGAR